MRSYRATLEHLVIDLCAVLVHVEWPAAEALLVVLVRALARAVVSSGTVVASTAAAATAPPPPTTTTRGDNDDNDDNATPTPTPTTTTTTSTTTALAAQPLRELAVFVLGVVGARIQTLVADNATLWTDR